MSRLKTLAERLRINANMMHVGERISWDSVETLMFEAAEILERLAQADAQMPVMAFYGCADGEDHVSLRENFLLRNFDPCTVLADPLVRRDDAMEALAQKQAEIDTLTNELRYIAMADVSSWDDPGEFRAWAQNRARHALAATPPKE